jgi:hypothetical protein
MRFCRRAGVSVASKGSLRLLAVFLFTGYGVATFTAQENGVVSVCVGRNGDMRLVDNAAACRKDEKALSWNVQGTPGRDGVPVYPDGRCWGNRIRFVDCGNGTVTDQLTGLIWLKDSTCLGRMSFADANRAAQVLKEGDCGLSDKSVGGHWRLPTLAEWQATTAQAATLACQPAFTDNSGTLCYDTVTDGAGVNQRALLGLSVSSYFWSSTIYEISSAAAWGAYLTGGGVSVGGLNDPFNLLPVWPVRGAGF